MKKFWQAFGIGITATSAVIIASGYGFIFKAIGKNISKKPLVPSIDDAPHFDFHTVENGKPKFWKKAENYNQFELPEIITKELENTKASSFLIVKNGELVFEKYWNGHNETSLMNSFSMAKGILSILVGIAIDEGKIKNEDQLFSDFFPQYAEDEFGKHLTLKHLMTMQSALDWPEEYHHPFAPNSKQYFVEDLGKQVFERKFNYMPGTKYEYQSASPQLLGFALRKAVGESLAFYLSKKIWKPLGMENSAKWSVDSTGMEKAFCCIHATARDFAKIGQLVLDIGKSDGLQIIKQSTLTKFLEPTPKNDAFCHSIWANKDCMIHHHFFYGFLGQFIIIIPEKDIVIVKTGHDNHLPVDDKLRPLQVGMFADEVSKMF